MRGSFIAWLAVVFMVCSLAGRSCTGQEAVTATPVAVQIETATPAAPAETAMAGIGLDFTRLASRVEAASRDTAALRLAKAAQLAAWTSSFLEDHQAFKDNKVFAKMSFGSILGSAKDDLHGVGDHEHFPELTAPGHSERQSRVAHGHGYVSLSPYWGIDVAAEWEHQGGNSTEEVYRSGIGPTFRATDHLGIKLEMEPEWIQGSHSHGALGIGLMVSLTPPSSH